MKEVAAYEYMPPHGSTMYRPPTPKWEVVLPWKSETVTERVDAETEQKAFRKAVMQLSKRLNLQPAILFSVLQNEKKFTVKRL